MSSETASFYWPSPRGARTADLAQWVILKIARLSADWVLSAQEPTMSLSTRASRRIPILFFLSCTEDCVNRVAEPAVAGFERSVKEGRKRAGIQREARVEFVRKLDCGV